MPATRVLVVLTKKDTPADQMFEIGIARSAHDATYVARPQPQFQKTLQAPIVRYNTGQIAVSYLRCSDNRTLLIGDPEATAR